MEKSWGRGKLGNWHISGTHNFISLYWPVSLVYLRVIKQFKVSARLNAYIRAYIPLPIKRRFSVGTTALSAYIWPQDYTLRELSSFWLLSDLNVCGHSRNNSSIAFLWPYTRGLLATYSTIGRLEIRISTDCSGTGPIFHGPSPVILWANWIPRTWPGKRLENEHPPKRSNSSKLIFSSSCRRTWWLAPQRHPPVSRRTRTYKNVRSVSFIFISSLEYWRTRDILQCQWVIESFLWAYASDWGICMKHFSLHVVLLARSLGYRKRVATILVIPVRVPQLMSVNCVYVGLHACICVWIWIHCKEFEHIHRSQLGVV